MDLPSVTARNADNSVGSPNEEVWKEYVRTLQGKKPIIALETLIHELRQLETLQKEADLAAQRVADLRRQHERLRSISGDSLSHSFSVATPSSSDSPHCKLSSLSNHDLGQDELLLPENAANFDVAENRSIQSSSSPCRLGAIRFDCQDGNRRIDRVSKFPSRGACDSQDGISTMPVQPRTHAQSEQFTLKLESVCGNCPSSPDTDKPAVKPHTKRAVNGSRVVRKSNALTKEKEIINKLRVRSHGLREKLYLARAQAYKHNVLPGNAIEAAAVVGNSKALIADENEIYKILRKDSNIPVLSRPAGISMSSELSCKDSPTHRLPLSQLTESLKNFRAEFPSGVLVDCEKKVNDIYRCLALTVFGKLQDPDAQAEREKLWKDWTDELSRQRFRSTSQSI